MDYLAGNHHPNLKVHENGLVYTNGRDKAVTWMNSTVNGRPVVARTGYIVEFNALWYNALCFVADLLSSDYGFVDYLHQFSDKVSKSFVQTFLNEYGYLLDYVDGDMMDWSVRPNMIFAAAFDYSPLDSKQKKGVVDIVTKELLTPKGLRSLSPKSGGIIQTTSVRSFSVIMHTIRVQHGLGWKVSIWRLICVSISGVLFHL